MDKHSDLRSRIEAEAQRLGASRGAVLKWRARGIPNSWKLKLISGRRVRFSMKDLERAESVGVRQRGVSAQ